ncbi:MAG: HAMP domain-containing histidine kinase [Deltaproteobacteria bacterium]|nr:HAMP domain-containing histidine kinase [Deltaproteobacteria bacterium]
MSRRPQRVTILTKLLLAYVLPTLLLFSVFGWMAYEFLRRDLDAELGRRLSAIAATTASQVRGKYLLDLRPGEETDRAYLNTLRKLEAARAKTGVERIYVFRPDHTSLCDTQQGVPIGQEYYTLDLDRHELSRVLAQGAAVASVLFRGKDGRFYKAGYAAVAASEDDPEIVAALAVEAPADYFGRLIALRRHILGYGALLFLAVVVASVVVATRITRPIRRLAVAAERIGRGDLAEPVTLSGRDEIALLSRTLDEMREALRHRDERSRMMLAGIAHEVRNPLGGIELYAGILRDELANDSEKLGHVSRIERELGHLEKVVNDFLEYARRPKPELKQLDLCPLLAEAVDMARASAEVAGVHLALETSRSAVTLGDPTQLHRAMLNLLANAVQATPSGGRVTVSLKPCERGLAIQVTDTGKGIPPEQCDKIFEPFFTTKEKGTGLGLAFVNEIMRDHGGRILLQSEVGRGTTFTLELPAGASRTSWEQS